MNYLNATINAEDYKNIPPFPPGYQAKEIEVFFGDSPTNSVYHYKNGKWIGYNPENAELEPVLQVLIDDQWAFIQAGDQVLLDRLGGIQQPTLPKQEEVVYRIAQLLGMEVSVNV